MSAILLALDQGTSSSRALLVDQNQQVLALAAKPLNSSFPNSGWVEQDPEEIWKSQWDSVLEVLQKAQINLGQVTGIGITNQRETLIAWDKKSGEALGPAIVWQCRRTADFCQSLKKQGLEPLYQTRTGLVLDPYFSGTKMAWMLENRPEVKAAAKQGDLALGTVDSWLIWKLTKGQVHATDASNASRTLLYNLHTLGWDPELAAPLGVPLEALPKVVDSSGVLGKTHPDWGAEIPIAGVAGDQQASLFGQACFKAGEAKNTYGTGCFLLANTGDKPVASKHGLLTTLAWSIGGKPTFALEGSVFMAGALVQWLRDQLGIIENAAQTETLARELPNNGGVYLVPAFVGLGAPHWDPWARGLIIGLGRETDRRHLCRAALEAIAFQTAELVEAMGKDRGGPLSGLKIDGGASQNGFLCQFQADLLGIPVYRPKNLEATALGAACLAGLALGVWRDLEHIAQSWQEAASFVPKQTKEALTPIWAGWNKALERSKGWAL